MFIMCEAVYLLYWIHSVHGSGSKEQVAKYENIEPHFYQVCPSCKMLSYNVMIWCECKLFYAYVDLPNLHVNNAFLTSEQGT